MQNMDSLKKKKRNKKRPVEVSDHNDENDDYDATYSGIESQKAIFEEAAVPPLVRLTYFYGFLLAEAWRQV